MTGPFAGSNPALGTIPHLEIHISKEGSRTDPSWVQVSTLFNLNQPNLGQCNQALSFLRRLSRKGKIAFIIITALATLGIIEAVNSSINCPPQQVLDSNMQITILGQHHVEYATHTRYHQHIDGHFTSNVSVALYVLTQSEFQQLNSTGDGIAYEWTTTYTTDGWLCSSKSCPVPAPVTPIGTGYILFYNPNPTTAGIQIGIVNVALERCYPTPFT